jgi:hypothetical protein
VLSLRVRLGSFLLAKMIYNTVLLQDLRDYMWACRHRHTNTHVLRRHICRGCHVVHMTRQSVLAPAKLMKQCFVARFSPCAITSAFSVFALCTGPHASPKSVEFDVTYAGTWGTDLRRRFIGRGRDLVLCCPVGRSGRLCSGCAGHHFCARSCLLLGGIGCRIRVCCSVRLSCGMRGLRIC